MKLGINIVGAGFRGSDSQATLRKGAQKTKRYRCFAGT
jgi:hypothetical protein